jgi:hypothetical protein
MRRSPTTELLVVLEEEVIAGQHARVLARHGHGDAGLAHGSGTALDVIPVPVGLKH